MEVLFDVPALSVFQVVTKSVALIASAYVNRHIITTSNTTRQAHREETKYFIQNNYKYVQKHIAFSEKMQLLRAYFVLILRLVDRKYIDFYFFIFFCRDVIYFFIFFIKIRTYFSKISMPSSTFSAMTSPISIIQSESGLGMIWASLHDHQAIKPSDTI